eukprot:788431-Rhodomonas_salina.1
MGAWWQSCSASATLSAQVSLPPRAPVCLSCRRSSRDPQPRVEGRVTAWRGRKPCEPRTEDREGWMGGECVRCG